MVHELSDSHEATVTESTATLRQVLRRLFTRPPKFELPAHTRAVNPVFSDAQIQAIYDAAFYWGVEAMRVERDRRDAEAFGITPAQLQEFDDRLRGCRDDLCAQINQALWHNDLIWEQRHVVAEIKNQARYWVEWRVRGFIREGYGSCEEVIERAAWAFREHLLTLEIEDLAPSENEGESA